MKKAIAILLALVMVLALCACGGGGSAASAPAPAQAAEPAPAPEPIPEPEPEIQKHAVGETVSTDIVEFTVNDAQFAFYAEGFQTSSSSGKITNPDKCCSPSENSSAFFTTSKGRSLMCLDFTITNTDRDTLNLFGSSGYNIVFTVKQGENIAQVKGYDLNNKDGDPFGFSLSYAIVSVSDSEFIRKDTTNMLLDAGKTSRIKVPGVVGFEPEDLSAPFELIVTLKNSNDETEEFVYSIT